MLALNWTVFGLLKSGQNVVVVDDGRVNGILGQIVNKDKIKALKKELLETKQELKEIKAKYKNIK